MSSSLLTGGLLFLVLLSSCQVDARPKYQVHPALQKLAVLSALASKAHGTGLGEIWSDCSMSGDKMKINAVMIKPDPPVKNEELTVNVNFTLSENVTGGQLKLNIKIDSVPIVTQEMDLCEAISQVNLMCPLSVGPHTASISIDLPDDIPSGHITGSQYLDDQNGKELACVALDLKL